MRVGERHTHCPLVSPGVTGKPSRTRGNSALVWKENVIRPLNRQTIDEDFSSVTVYPQTSNLWWKHFSPTQDKQTGVVEWRRKAAKNSFNVLTSTAVFTNKINLHKNMTGIDYSLMSCTFPAGTSAKSLQNKSLNEACTSIYTCQSSWTLFWWV